MGEKVDLQGTAAERLRHIWLSQARKFADHTSDLREFIQAAHKWSDLWHATVWRMPDAARQQGLVHHSEDIRLAPYKRRRTRAVQQRYGKKMAARFPGTAGHRHR